MRNSSWPISPQKLSIASRTRGSSRSPAADLARGQAVLHRAHLLGDVTRRGAEQRVAPGHVAVDGVARAGGVGDLHERQLGHRQRRHLDVHQERGIAVVGRGAHLHARPRLVGGRGDADEAVAVAAHRVTGSIMEALEQERRDQPGVEGLRHRRRQRVDLRDAR